jgi:hypothetical protein
MTYINAYIGYKVIDGKRKYLTHSKILSNDKSNAVRSMDICYFLSKKLEPEIIKITQRNDENDRG